MGMVTADRNMFGLTAIVQSSSMGKYGITFSRLHSLKAVQQPMNLEHVLSQLEYMWSLQEMQ
jgi:hypothetical protein